MATTSFFRTTRVSSTSTDYEILNDENFKNLIKYRMGWLDNSDGNPTSEELIRAESLYQDMIAEGFKDLSLTILPATETRLSVNNEPYSNQFAFAGAVFPLTAGDYIRMGIRSIRVEDSGISLDIMLNGL